MTSSCPFCQIIKNDEAVLKAAKYSVAFLDINPIRPGHVLVVPKQHEPDFFNLPDYIHADMMQLAKYLAFAQKAVFQPLKVGMLVAGFDISHAHLHLIPMHDYHDITSKQILEGTVTKANQLELQKNEQSLKKVLQNI